MDYSKQAQFPEDMLTKPDQEQGSVSVPRDAIYTVTYTDDGVYLEITKELNDGASLRPDCVLYDISRRGIVGFNADTVRVLMRRNEKRIRLGGQQEQKDVDSDVIVTVSSDEMTAGMMLFPPVGTGKKLSADDILQRIDQNWNIKYGLDEQTVRQAVDSSAFYKFIEIAKGKQPEKGKDGELIFMFSTQRSYAPEILPDGSADYKNMKLFERVSAGDVLVTAVPPENGIDGVSVKGTTIAAQRGREKKLPKGKNVKLSDDGYSLVAERNGRVDFIRDRVEVSDVYHIKGDVNMSVGNIVFEGDVIVEGNVISGLSIEAAGTVEVRGYVEGATITAGKDIILRNGMQGMSQGMLNAGKNIVARFIERSTISAKGDIYADYIVQCIVTAGVRVVVKGKWGKLLGGVIRAGKEITANTIGSPSSDRTQIELGVLPDERARYTKLDAERGQLKAQLNRIQNITRMPVTTDISPDRLAMRQKLVEAGEQLEEQYERINQEIEMLKETLCANSEARVNAFRAVYPNVKIQIDSGVFMTRSMIEFATFRYKDGEVGFTACEIKA